MSTATDYAPQHLRELEQAIAQAMSKTNVPKEAQLGRYLPTDTNHGHIHPLIFGKMKRKKPATLCEMIRKHILEKDHPQIVTSKPSRAKPELKIKRTSQLKLKKSQIDRLVKILQKSGDIDLIPILSPHQSLTQVKKLMLEMIRRNELDQGLIDTYASLVIDQKTTSANG